MELPNHGANPLRLYKQAGITPPEQILDFSENVHPFGAPDPLVEHWPQLLELVAAYPDPDGEPFRSAAAQFHRVGISQVAAANGAAEVFTWLARRYRSKQVVLVEPAFSEYRQTLEAEHAGIRTIQLKPENHWQLAVEDVRATVPGCAALYICNPHNPTGVLVDVDTLKEMAQICLEHNCELVIDEAFIDFVGEAASFVPFLAKFSNVIVVRSMTKMYAIPGLRLGYVISQSNTIEQLKHGAAHWNVNGLSAAIGADLFKESSYRDNIIQAALEERLAMQQFFAAYHCRTSHSAVNFLSFQLPDPNQSAKFFADLLKKGVVLRHTESFRGMDGKWFRIGMKSRENMKTLREAIAEWLEAN